MLRAATDKIMANVAALLGGLRGLTPPTEPFHPAVARRKLRQDLRALANGQDATDSSHESADSGRDGADASHDGADASHDGAPGAGTPDS